MQISCKIQLRIKEKSWNLGILALEMAFWVILMPFEYCSKAKEHLESWNYSLGGGFVLCNFLV